MLPKNFIFLETFTLKYGLTDQNSKPLEWFNKHYFSYSLKRDTHKEMIQKINNVTLFN